MATTDGRLHITFNGEIYNFLDLRRELQSKGHTFVSHTDTEVILAAWEAWGVECLKRLRGMFAFVIWDAAERVFFAARDRIGKKPLHYLLDGDGIAFASEPKAFLADPGFEPRPDIEALSAYLTYQYVASPLSAFQGVRKLPPAHYLLIRDGEMRVERYWRLSYKTKRQLSEAEAEAELLDRLREAVRLRLISDVPLGAFLSGGVDSSTIVALMAQVGTGPVKTFSIGFEEKEYDELPYARLVAQKYATEHHEFIVRPDAAAIFPQLVWHYNEPFADSSAIPTYYLSELARRHVTVALNGDAGDENFGGYRRYIVPPAAQRFDALPDSIRTAVAAIANTLPGDALSSSFLNRGQRWLRRLSETPPRRYSRRVMIFEPELKAALCTPDFTRQVSSAAAEELLVDTYHQSDAPDVVDAFLDMDANHYLPDCLLVKVDIATMAHGLEGRSPMLDHEFMEFAATLPSSLKLRNGDTKYILKRVARRLIPEETIDRPKKGFGVPLERWFQHELRELTGDLLLDGRLAARGYFHPSVVERLVQEHWNGTARWENQMWSLLMLESWHRMFVDDRPAAAPVSDSAARVAS